MMCKPSNHLIEYLENQNLSVRDIIADLPDELPITEFKEEKNGTNASSTYRDSSDNNTESSTT